MSPVRATALQLSLDLQLRTLQLSRYARSKRSPRSVRVGWHQVRRRSGSATSDLPVCAHGPVSAPLPQRGVPPLGALPPGVQLPERAQAAPASSAGLSVRPERIEKRDRSLDGQHPCIPRPGHVCGRGAGRNARGARNGRGSSACVDGVAFATVGAHCLCDGGARAAGPRCAPFPRLFSIVALSPD